MKVTKLSRAQEDRRLVTLRAMAEEAGRREDVYGALYDQGWQDALLHLTKILFPWHDGSPGGPLATRSEGGGSDAPC